MDTHSCKKGYEAKVKLIENLPEGKHKTILQKYVKWHNRKIEKGTIEYSSAKRSLEIAYKILQEAPKIFDLNEEALKKWWLNNIERKVILNSKREKIIGKEKISKGTIEKERSQTLKLLKFIDFLKTKQELIYFNPGIYPRVEISKYLILEEDSKTDTRKEKDKIRITQHNVKDILDTMDNGTFSGTRDAALCCLLNDGGMRFSEAAGLTCSDLRYDGEYFVVSLPRSKTRVREICCMLAEPRVRAWLNVSPNKNKKNGLLFCNKKGEPVKYDNVCRNFKKALEKNNIKFPKGYALHWLRHLFASRAEHWPENIVKYWLGWKEERSMRANYTNYTYKSGLKYYLDMLQEENNPMLNKKISYLEENKEKEMLSTIEEMVNASVEKRLKETKE